MPVSPISREVKIPDHFTAAQAEYLQNHRGKEVEALAEDTGLSIDDITAFFENVPRNLSLFLRREGITIMTKGQSEKSDRPQTFKNPRA